MTGVHLGKDELFFLARITPFGPAHVFAASCFGDNAAPYCRPTWRYRLTDLLRGASLRRSFDGEETRCTHPGCVANRGLVAGQ